MNINTTCANTNLGLTDLTNKINHGQICHIYRDLDNLGSRVTGFYIRLCKS